MTESLSYGDTFRTGFLLGEKAEPGDVYCLCGDLGVGKTVYFIYEGKETGCRESNVSK